MVTEAVVRSDEPGKWAVRCRGWAKEVSWIRIG